MKKRLGIVVMALFWCNTVYSNELKGIKIFCQPDKTPVLGVVVNTLENYMSFEFNSSTRVKVIDISPYAGEQYLGKKSYTVSTHKYKTTLNHIIIKNFKKGELTLGRQNITLMSYQGYSCNLVSKDENLNRKMKNIHNNLLKEAKAKSKNKI
jgi:hypothetical protein